MNAFPGSRPAFDGEDARTVTFLRNILSIRFPANYKDMRPHSNGGDEDASRTTERLEDVDVFAVAVLHCKSRRAVAGSCWARNALGVGPATRKASCGEGQLNCMNTLCKDHVLLG
jgi:hypothetical protein